MAGDRPRICAAITSSDQEAIERVEPYADLFELRIDLIGPEWQEVAACVVKPWIATNRCREEGGAWQGSEAKRVEVLLSALDAGAAIVDIELRTQDVTRLAATIRERAKCLISSHNLAATPPMEDMEGSIRRMLDAGADICKLVTTAQRFEDNVQVLRLIRHFPDVPVIAFSMGETGQVTRVLSPLVGGYCTYASTGEGRESAPGQVTADELALLYGMMGYGRE